MATTSDYIEYVMECLEGAGTGMDLWYRPMFGEYCIYAYEKPLFFVCNNAVYVKRIPELAELLAHCDSGEPYPGAKGYAILDVEGEEHLGAILTLLYDFKPMPKPKRRKSKSIR